MSEKRRKKSLVGWTMPWWESYLYFTNMPPHYTKQQVKFLRCPTITDECTKYIDHRSHKKIKVRITIEEI
jgi:hypothetical protein